ncbi:iron-sulfur cluster assembly protein CIA2 [Aspergillus novofumigatus IBT 16806]|uniref:Putative cytoplasmic protein required for cell viability n=1 Tax=Aspergillus novofumigatus (strain IBT 16806) TaxID=1392255 RepID=A0A2I1BZT8_ASPN1|nr:putative cytoplasmic protein required for cell viability [Aspergillus novofumigatus IBT 16806]PKX90897.1 putative cytoplasmic protein required for cell viability [Aspergillus novofumigatus IBT 16806]
MASEMQNSNPIILNAADLPTRLPKAPQKPYAYGTDVFSSTLQSLGQSADSFSLNSHPDSEEDNDMSDEPIDEQEIFDLVSTISDPEHPISLGSLAVVSLADIMIKPSLPHVPGSPFALLATVIGLGVRVRLEQSLPPRFRVDVRIKEGTHSTADEVNKQLGDKERVAAALENGTLMGVIAKMLETCQ